MGSPAARVGDKVVHNFGHCHSPHPSSGRLAPVLHSPQPLPIITGCSTVTIGGAPAARMADPTVPCAPAGCTPSAGGTVLMGSTTVNIGGKPAARLGDAVTFPGCTGPIACTAGK